jgi:hypothetical protein
MNNRVEQLTCHCAQQSIRSEAVPTPWPQTDFHRAKSTPAAGE